MSSPDASVIIPSYNSAETIERCLRSILSQQDVCLEVHVIDDRGSDSTRDIVEAVSQDNRTQHKIIKHFRDEPLGQSTARNVGLDRATGQYVLFLDADDEYAHERVVVHWIGYARALDAELVCAHFYTVNSANGQQGRCRPIARPSHRQVFDVVDNPALVNVSSCWQILYLRSFLEGGKFRFRTDLRQREDRIFFVPVLLASSRIAVTDDHLVRHFIYHDSSYNTLNWNQVDQYVVHLSAMTDLMKHSASKDDSPDEFIKANNVLYMNSLQNYWSKFLVPEWNKGGDEAKNRVVSFLKHYKNLDWAEGTLHDCEVFVCEPKNERAIREFELDLIRLLLRKEKFEIAMAVLDGARIGFSEFWDLCETDAPSDEEEVIIARYLSHQRLGVARPYVGKQAPAGRSSKPPRILLHVGPPKTGSSSLQNFLELNRFRLLKAGFWYPSTGSVREMRSSRRLRTAGHARLIKEILEDNTTIVEQLESEMTDLPIYPHTIVISSENILSHRFYDGPDSVRKIVNALSFGDVEAMACFRDLSLWIESYYKEMLSNPFNGFIAPADNFVDLLERKGLFEYRNMAAMLEEICGSDKCHILCYERVLQAGGVVSELKKLLGISEIDFLPIPGELSNASDTAAFASYVRVLKRSASDYPDVMDAHVRRLQRNGPARHEKSNLVPSCLKHDVLCRNSDTVAYFTECFGLDMQTGYTKSARQGLFQATEGKIEIPLSEVDRLFNAFDKQCKDRIATELEANETTIDKLALNERGPNHGAGRAESRHKGALAKLLKTMRRFYRNRIAC